MNPAPELGDGIQVFLELCPFGRQKEDETQSKDITFDPADGSSFDFERALPWKVKTHYELQSLGDVDFRFRSASSRRDVHDLTLPFDLLRGESQLTSQIDPPGPSDLLFFFGCHAVDLCAVVGQ